MLEAGVPIVTVSRRLDHRRVSTTLDRYAQAVPDGDAHACATLRAIVENAANEAAGQNCVVMTLEERLYAVGLQALSVDSAQVFGSSLGLPLGPTSRKVNESGTPPCLVQPGSNH